MFNTNKILLFYFMWIEVYTLVQGKCFADLERMGRNRVQLSRRIGSRTIPITDKFNVLIMAEHDVVEAYCSTGFDIPFQTEAKFFDLHCKKLGQIICPELEIQFNSDERYVPFELLDFPCKRLDWTIFESKTSFDWCNSNENLGSFIMSIKNTDAKENIAEICFDFAKMTSKIISYISVKNDNNELSFINNQFQNRASNEEVFWRAEKPYVLDITPKLTEWQYLENFEHGSLLPKDMLSNLEDSVSVSSVIWWSNLRVLNWNRFMEALHERSKTSAYKIYTGTGGVVTAPLKTKFENVTFTERRSLHPSNETIPAYIWNVLHEINGAEEFVVIGYNSPYFEFFNSSEIIFCRDICEEIPWLKEVSYYFKYSILGRIFCCSLEEAKRSEIFEGVLSVLPEKPQSVDITSTSDFYMKYVTTIANEQNDFAGTTDASPV